MKYLDPIESGTLFLSGKGAHRQLSKHLTRALKFNAEFILEDCGTRISADAIVFSVRERTPGLAWRVELYLIRLDSKGVGVIELMEGERVGALIPREEMVEPGSRSPKRFDRTSNGSLLTR